MIVLDRLELSLLSLFVLIVSFRSSLVLACTYLELFLVSYLDSFRFIVLLRNHLQISIRTFLSYVNLTYSFGFIIYGFIALVCVIVHKLKLDWKFLLRKSDLSSFFKNGNQLKKISKFRFQISISYFDLENNLHYTPILIDTDIILRQILLQMPIIQQSQPMASCSTFPRLRHNTATPSLGDDYDIIKEITGKQPPMSPS